MLCRMRNGLVACALLAGLGVSIQAAGTDSTLEALPEGGGIAARYPADQGIGRDAAVIFADGFETTASGVLADGYHWDGDTKWDNTWGGCLIVEDAENVNGGRKALQMTVVRPGTGQAAGVGIQKYFEEGYDTLFLRYYAKFEKNTEVYHGGAHNGAGMSARALGVPQACPGVRADGSNKFDVSLDTWRPDPEIPSPGHLVLYVYHMDQGGRWGDQFFASGRVIPEDRSLFGEDFVPRPDMIPERDRWYCYEVMLRANTPGLRDGRTAFWVDGKLAGDFPNLRFRDVPTLKSNHVGLDLYTNHRRVQRDITMWFDDVVVATSYIGPRTEPR